MDIDFVKKYGLITLGALALSSVGFLFASTSNVLFVMLSIFVASLLSFAAYLIVSPKLNSKKQSSFLSAILSGMAIKFILAIASILLVYFWDKNFVTLFTISFLIAYIFFTVFEIKKLTINLRQNSEMAEKKH